jgi:hypothetical protein
MIRKLLLAGLSLCLTLGALEAYLRSKPPARIQRVMHSLNSFTFESVDGVPLWHSVDPGHTLVTNRSCMRQIHDRPEVLLIGDSIFFGVSLDPGETLGPVMQKQLAERLGRPSCVVNLSEPGFSFEAEEVVLRRGVAELNPKVVVLEIWQNSVARYVSFSDSVYAFGNMVVDEKGLPNPGISAELNHALFSQSGIWRHLSTGLATTKKGASRDKWEALVVDELEPMRLWLKERDVALVLAYATGMATPFSEGREQERKTYAPVSAWAAEKGIPQMFFDEAMKGKKVEEMRIDPCCHLSSQGIVTVGQVLTSLVAETLSTTEE